MCWRPEVQVCWRPLPAHWLSPPVLRPWWLRVRRWLLVPAGGTVVASGDDGAAVASGDETGTLESDEPPQATARRAKDTAIAAKNISLGTGFRPPAAFVIIRYNCYSLRVPDSLHLRPDPQRRRDGAGLLQGTGRGPRPGTPLLNLNYEWPMVLDAYILILHRAQASMTRSGRGGLL